MPVPTPRLTARGRRSRERILAAAAELIHRRGVHATSVGEVLAAAGAGKSQFYHYFGNKEGLVREVLALQLARHVTSRRDLLERLDTWEGIAAWFDHLVSWAEERGCRGGCPIGSMAAELADREPDLASDLAAAFDRLRSDLVRGLGAMKRRGELREDTDPEALADFVLAAEQGGMLLAKIHKDASRLRNALDRAFAHLRSLRRED